MGSMTRSYYSFAGWLSWLVLLLFLPGIVALKAQSNSQPSVAEYTADLNITYCQVNGKELKLNAFLLTNSPGQVPAIVEIHGGWWYGGSFAPSLESVGGHQAFIRHQLAVFSIEYRLGKRGGFPACIRDCRNAIRFIRKNAQRFNIDPNRIEVTGGSAGGHLSLMVAMVPESFDDGGPTPGLEGVSAQVAGSFSYISPTDFLRFWNQGPDDVVTNQDGQLSFRQADSLILNDSRPRLRFLFHGVTPDTPGHQDLYEQMCPAGHIRGDVPPLLICDGEKDPIVPGLHGKWLYQQLQAAHADVMYWMTPNGGHSFPGGPGFDKVLDNFLEHSLKCSSTTNGAAP